MEAYLIIFIALVAIGLAYIFVVVFPLFGILAGGMRLMFERRGAKEALHGLKFDRDLGFTMADGGEKEKKGKLDKPLNDEHN